MILVDLFENADGDVYGFQIEDHGEDHICSAVSMLVFNAVNSVEAFTDEEFFCDYPQDGGGFMRFRVPSIENGTAGRDAKLLTASLALGLRSLIEEYPEQIRYADKTRV